MRLLAGTSGFAYKQWKGPFYPPDQKDAGMLRYYSSRLPTVELNNTFYRMPRREVVDAWAKEVGDEFVFVLKASRRITHIQRLRSAGDLVTYLWEATSGLGSHRGPFLFQLPPNHKHDQTLLLDFLAVLPAGLRAAFEFRHPSWHCDEVYAELSRAGHAFCAADTDEGDSPELVRTADFGYVRLRRTHYDASDLSSWCERLRRADLREAYVFFKHEDEGVAPRLACELSATFGVTS